MKKLRKKVGEKAGKRKRVDLTVSSRKKKTRLPTFAENSAAAPKNFSTVPENSAAVPENSTAILENSAASPKNSTTAPEHSAAVVENSNYVPEKNFLPPKESENAFQKAYKTFDLPNNHSSLGIKEFPHS
ncbi:hypothetical protein TNCV_4606591 [Trichonephila clavipes]|nr:hypothetical protein TNCV_4606591 [Trichonephila clavipes]